MSRDDLVLSKQRLDFGAYLSSWQVSQRLAEAIAFPQIDSASPFLSRSPARDLFE
ncbi:MAG TPA: hypothetical protein VNO24_19135 [Blastocatellia bacterium]|nr:hypothetical protein [Blastocatellia bacterium]